jgi:serine protease
VFVALVAPASASAGRLLVSVGKGDTARFLARTGLRPAGPVVPEIGLVTVAEPDQGARWVKGLHGVRAVEPDGHMRLRLVPNDPAVTATESRAGGGTPLEWWLARENFFNAWDITRGANAKVAVIDSGIDASHPDLAGKLAAAVDQDGVEADGPATSDVEGHGTHVASLACAATNNGFGIAGAGYDCNLIVEKTDLSDASIAASIVDAANKGAGAINMSFGDDGSRAPVQALVDAVDYAVSKGSVPVAAAADEDTEEQGQPANLLQPTGTAADITKGKGLVVTAADFGDRRPGFAGHGSQVSIAAYGSFGSGGPPGLLGAYPGNVTDEERGSVLPPEPPCLCRTTVAGDNRFAYLEGTSMSSPQVAAAAAMVRALNPDLSATDVVTLLKQTARRPANTGWNADLGWGILDAGAAVRAAASIDRRAPTSRARAAARTRRTMVTVRVTGSDTGSPGLPASGLASIELFASRNGKAPRRVATLPGPGRVKVKLRRRTTYAFTTIATDRAGNREAAHPQPDAVTRALKPLRRRR